MDKTPAGLGTAWGSWQSARNPALRDCHEVIIVAHRGQPGRPAGADTIDADTFTASTASVWRIRPAGKSWHPAPFPAELARRLIELYSYAGDLVLDPFAGSFTAPIEAARAGRRGVGVEASAEYVGQARAAWAGRLWPCPADGAAASTELKALGASARRRRRRSAGVASV